MHRLILLTGALSMTIASSPAGAQVPLTPRGLGLGGAGIGGARGQEAIFYNPANLGLLDSPRWSLSLLQLTGSLVPDGLEFSEFQDLIDSGGLSDNEKDALFAEVPAAGVAVSYDARAALGSLQIGHLALGVSYNEFGGHSLSRDLVELFLYGYDEGRTDYGVGNTVGSRATYWDVALGYGASFGGISLGATGHFLRGGSLSQSWLTTPRLDLIARDVEVSYTGVRTEGGTGFALDFGVAIQPSPRLTLSGSVSNAFAQMDWSDDLFLRNVTLNRADLEDTDLLDLATEFSGSQRPVQAGDERLIRGLTPERLQEEAYPPTSVTLGVGWTAPSRTHLAASYYGRLTEGSLHGPWDRMLGVGIEQRIPVLTLRAGYANNFDGGSLLSGGLGLGPINAGIARRSEESEVDGSREGWVAVFGLSTRM